MVKYSQIFRIISIFFLSLSFFTLGGFVFAEDDISLPNEEFSINLDKETIAKGYTVSAFDNSLKLSLVPGILSESTRVDVVKINETMEMPWMFDRISDVYQFEFRNKSAYDNHTPFYIQFSYSKKTNNYKQVYFYDKNFNSWRPLPTTDFPNEQFVRSLIHLPYARIAIFDNPEILSVGKASWYKYKGGDFAASPDFPKDSIIRVYNTENGKFVDVKINDFGPERDLFPDRVIDLDKVAFGKISPTTSGIINIKIDPLYIPKDEQGNIMTIASTGVSSEPAISAKEFVVIKKETGDVLYEKDKDVVHPIASLTKLVAMKVFMDTNPDFEKTVSYSKADEEYNYKYVENKWEVSGLNIDDGDTMKIGDLFYISLVGSTNNTIETLVRVSGLSRDEFIKKMNETVQSWGAKSAYFAEPTGLAPENVSSPADYAIIMKSVLDNEKIREASTKKKYEFTSLRDKVLFRRYNTNLLFSSLDFQTIGSKTGYLDEAGYCLAIQAKKDNKEIISVIMGAPTRDLSFYETEKLLRYGFKKYD